MCIRDSPEVIFAKFGDSTLDFELRVTIPSREVYFSTMHDLHMAIDREFRNAGIEIAFPQQDVHLHGVERALANINANSGQQPQNPPPAIQLKVSPATKRKPAA